VRVRVGVGVRARVRAGVRVRVSEPPLATAALIFLRCSGLIAPGQSPS